MQLVQCFETQSATFLPTCFCTPFTSVTGQFIVTPSENMFRVCFMLQQIIPSTNSN